MSLLSRYSTQIVHVVWQKRTQAILKQSKNFFHWGAAPAAPLYIRPWSVSAVCAPSHNRQTPTVIS